jgi:hypothetical protein
VQLLGDAGHPVPLQQSLLDVGLDVQLDPGRPMGFPLRVPCAFALARPE